MDRVRQRGGYVRDQLRALRALPATVTREAFVADRYLPAAVRYQFQTGIEALIDVAYHLSAKLADHAPTDAHDAFLTMVREKVLDAERMPRYHEMLRFRNRMVHGYLLVDNGRLYDMIGGEDLADIEAALEGFEAAADRAAQLGDQDADVGSGRTDA